MGIFDKLFRSKSENKVGITEPVCPYCEVDLEKFPSRKIKCKKCGNHIYVRTRPKDRKKILIKESEIEIVEELKSIEGGYHEEFLEKKREKEEVVNRLREKHKREPTENEILLDLRQNEINESIRLRNWSNLVMELVGQGELLSDMKQKKVSLDRFLLSYYVELNGGNNLCGMKPSDCPFSEFEPSEPTHSVGKTLSKQILKEHNYSYEEVMGYVDSFVKHFHEKYNHPISPEHFSQRIKKELFT